MRAPLDSSICPPLGVVFEPCEGVSHAQAPDPIAAANALRARRVDCERLVAESAATPQALHAHLRVAIAVGSGASAHWAAARAGARRLTRHARQAGHGANETRRKISAWFPCPRSAPGPSFHIVNGGSLKRRSGGHDVHASKQASKQAISSIMGRRQPGFFWLFAMLASLSARSLARSSQHLGG